MANDALQKLITAIDGDVSDRSDYMSRIDALRTERFRRSGKEGTYPYPNAPDLVEPIIDDAIADSVNRMVDLIWRNPSLVLMTPLTDAAFTAKDMAVAAFEALLKLPRLKMRQRTEQLLDFCESDGLGIAKVVDLDVSGWLEGIDGTIATFLPVDIRDCIFPTATRELETAERVCHQVWYTVREFTQEAKLHKWVDWETDVAHFHTSLKDSDEWTPDRAIDVEGTPEAERNNESESVSLHMIRVWEVYHWKQTKGGDYEQTRTVLCPDTPKRDKPLQESKYTGKDWPFVACYYGAARQHVIDTRGIAELTEANQQLASGWKTAKAIQMDYWANPTYEPVPGSPIQNQVRPRIHPGAVLPGIKPTVNPRIDGIWDSSADQERASAQRRIGSTQGAFSSTQNRRETKTATEVTAGLQEALQAISVAVMRFAEPYGAILQKIWDRMGELKPTLDLPMFKQVQVNPSELFALPYMVRSALSSADANPYYQFQALMSLAPLLEKSPHLKRYGFDAKAVALINPLWVDELLQNPAAIGGFDVPIEQAVAQLAQNMQQNNQVLQSHDQYLSALAQEDAMMDQGGGQGAMAPQMAAPQGAVAPAV